MLQSFGWKESSFHQSLNINEASSLLGLRNWLVSVNHLPYLCNKEWWGKWRHNLSMCGLIGMMEEGVMRILYMAFSLLTHYQINIMALISQLKYIYIYTRVWVPDFDPDPNLCGLVSSCSKCQREILHCLPSTAVYKALWVVLYSYCSCEWERGRCSNLMWNSFRTGADNFFQTKEIIFLAEWSNA